MVEIWKMFSPDFLEFTLVFLHIFSRFFQNFEKFKIWIQNSPISNLRQERPRRISKNAAEFFNHDCG
jgi:hypothetical protein